MRVRAGVVVVVMPEPSVVRGVARGAGVAAWSASSELVRIVVAFDGRSGAAAFHRCDAANTDIPVNVESVTAVASTRRV